MEFTNLNKDRKSIRKTSTDLGSMVFGKVPPQAKEAEEAIKQATFHQKIAAELLKREYANSADTPDQQGNHKIKAKLNSGSNNTY